MACAAFLAGPAITEDAVANGDTRTIHLRHAHTHESIDATYMVGGRYDPVVLEKLNWFLRDWRRDEPTHMDPKLFDTVWEVYREAGSQQAVEVMSAYRSPETNSMLRHATRGVAEHSQHILGKAMDQHYVDVPMSKIRDLAMRLQRGGVGFYPTAGTPFVHMDVGGVRHWPRMSYDQLASLFPDGKTVHIPSNGQPLAGYETARAELEARGDSFDYPTAGEVKSKGFFAWLFGGGGDEEADGEASRDAAPAPRRAAPSRFAASDPASVGSTGDDAARSANSDDAGMHAFAMSSSRGADPIPASPARRGPAGRTAVASLPDAVQPAIDPQQALAAEMRRQEAQRAAAAAQAEQRAAAAAQAEQRAAAAAQAEQRAAAQTDAGAAPPAPEASPRPPLAPRALPSRRPTEVASAGPRTAAPAPRPDSAPRGDRAAPPSPARLAAAPLGRAVLPAAITQGLGQAPAPGRVLAFAPPAAAVPLPATRPPLVAARLDRSNFQSLTGTARTDRVVPRVGLGSSVGALRAAAQTNAASLSGEGPGAQRRGFAARATELSTDSFSGSAVAPNAKVDTATLRRRAAAPAAAD